LSETSDPPLHISMTNANVAKGQPNANDDQGRTATMNH
jgi:hypothetical protein